MSAILELKNVVKNYTQGHLHVEALRGINLKVEKGDFIAILGPSGSGKSTLMNIMGFLDTPTTGEIFLRGKKLDTFSKTELTAYRQEIGFVFQRFNLIQRLSVLQNIELSLVIKEEKEPEKRLEKTNQLLKLVGLTTRKDHTPKELSGGQQQRVAIARAIVKKPKFLLLDEPTGNVDSKTRDQIMALIKKLNETSNVTVILITHDLRIAELANRVLYMVDGKLVDKDEFEKPIKLE